MLLSNAKPFHLEAREKALPLCRLLKKAERFTWTTEAEEALSNLKKTLTTTPILVPPSTRRASAPIRRSNDPGRQRSCSG
jgi:hypothetical protein